MAQFAWRARTSTTRSCRSCPLPKWSTKTSRERTTVRGGDKFIEETTMNRRHVLNMAATVAAGLPLWPARVFAQAPGPAMTALSAYMSAAATRALPAEADEHAKHHLLD